MRLDDESLLTAYLDGELAPDRRLSVESALASDSELAERLRRIASVSGLIAGLPRPVLEVDLAAAIQARIASRPAPRGPIQRIRSLSDRLPWTVAMLGGSSLAVAASLLVALVLALQARRPAPAPAPASRPPHDIAAVTAPLPPAPASAIEPVAPVSELLITTAIPPSGKDDPGNEPAPPRRTRSSDQVAAAADHAMDAEAIRTMLDSPNLRRIFIVTDVLGGATLDRVEDLVQNTPRTDSTYGRITVTQGIVIDPRHPNEATVFALVMNEQELKHFQRKLEQAVPQAVEDVDADPRTVTQLADIGQVAVLSGSTATEVVIPGSVSPRIALRTDERSNGAFHEESRITSEFGTHGDAGIADLGLATEAGANGEAGEPGGMFRKRPPAMARRDAPPSAAKSKSEEGAVETARGAKPPDPVGPLGEALANASALKEAPAIVLVWVTSP